MKNRGAGAILGLIWPFVPASMGSAAPLESRAPAPGMTVVAPANPTASPPPPTGPILWAADSMLMKEKEHGHHVFLDGNVHITRSDLLVLGEKAVADLAAQLAAPPELPGKNSKDGRDAKDLKGSKSAKNEAAAKKKAHQEPVAVPGLDEEVQHFIIDGAVHIERADRQADGDHATYDNAGQTLTLEGPARPNSSYLPNGSPLPVLRDEKEVLSGNKILLKLDSDEILVAQPHLVLLKSQAPGANGGPPVPARVDAKTLLVDQDKHQMRFRDEVVLHRADLVVLAPRMVAHSGEDGEIEQLEMSGGVQLKQGTRRAVGRNAVYDAKERTMVLTGDPRLFDRGDELRGDVLTMSLDTDEVRGQHVRSIMHPDVHADEENAAIKPGAKAAAKPIAKAQDGEGGK